MDKTLHKLQEGQNLNHDAMVVVSSLASQNTPTRMLKWYAMGNNT